ncbi:Uncharacterised protein [uncultured archaeon]|nr:Uncharacterised protein [uncultured archaeon]
MYIFNWENVPGKDNGRLIEYLEQKYGVDWVRTAKIEKIGNNEIRIATEKNFLSLILNNQKTNVILKINNVRTDEFSVKIENGNVNIYKDTQQVTRKEVKLESGYPYAVLGGLVIAGLIIVAFLGYSGVQSAGIFSTREAFFVIGASILILTAASIYLLFTLRNTISVLKIHEEELQSARDAAQEERLASLESTLPGATTSPGPRVDALEPQLASLEKRITALEVKRP